MPEIGLFPLALVLVPTERVPLHIFEPRYKALIGQCLADDTSFGLLLEDEDGRRDVGTRAAVLEVLHEFEDGRMNIVVEGRERFRLIAPTEGQPYPTGEVEPVADDAAEPDPAERDRAISLFRQLAEVAQADVDEPQEDSEWLSFEVAARVDFGLEPKQELLELRSEGARLRRLAELLEHAIEAISRERAVRALAATNGRVSQGTN